MLQTGRAYSVGSGYRYGFNGKENDNEVKGNGNQQDYGMRIYDTRVGRFLSVYPLINNIVFYSPFLFAGNKPIFAIDRNGEIEIIVHHKIYSQDGKTLIKTYTNRLIIETVEDLRGINREPLQIEIVEYRTPVYYQTGGGTLVYDVPKAQFAKIAGGGESYEDRMWSGWEGKLSKSVYKTLKKFWPPAKLNDAWVNGNRDPSNNEYRSSSQGLMQTAEAIIDGAGIGRAPFVKEGVKKLVES